MGSFWTIASCCSMAADLKKLRAKNIVQRIGQTRRYESTASGLRAMVALVVLRNKAIKPLLAAAQRRRKSRGAQNPRPIDRHYETIRMAMQRVFDELGLAALCLFGCFSKGPGIGSRSGTGTIYGCQGPTS